MKINEKLLKKYSSTGPRYTSYPPATFFDTNFTNDDFKEKLIVSNSEFPQNISVYIRLHRLSDQLLLQYYKYKN